VGPRGCEGVRELETERNDKYLDLLADRSFKITYIYSIT